MKEEKEAKEEVREVGEEVQEELTAVREVDKQEKLVLTTFYVDFSRLW